MELPKLNSRQRKFCHLYSQGMTAAKAYVQAGYSPNGVEASASQLLGNPKISLYLKELQKKAENSAICTRQEVLEGLSSIARDNENRKLDRISSYAAISKLQGFNEPDKLEVNATPLTQLIKDHLK